MLQTEDRTNLETFEALFLSLGPDVVKLDGSRHDAELMTAKASAAGRWLRLQQLEAQVEREAAIRGFASGAAGGGVPGADRRDGFVARIHPRGSEEGTQATPVVRR